MPANETREAVKLRASALKQVTATHSLLSTLVKTKYQQRIVKWQDVAKYFKSELRVTTSKDGKKKIEGFLKDAENILKLAKCVRDSTNDQIKLIKALDLTADAKKLETAMKALEKKAAETEKHSAAYKKEKDKTGKLLQKAMKDSQYSPNLARAIKNTLKEQTTSATPLGTAKALSDYVQTFVKNRSKL